jgi:hypothetical protein
MKNTVPLKPILLTLAAISYAGVAIAECPNAIRIGQMFVSKGPETGKGNMIVVDGNGGIVYELAISGCNSERLDYSFLAGRYANTKMDNATVKISVIPTGGAISAYDEIIDAHTADYSQIGSALQKVEGDITWKGKPEKLLISVTPGDWGIELRKLKLEFEKEK